MWFPWGHGRLGLRELTLGGGIPRFRGRGDGSIENMSKYRDRRRGFPISRGAST
jgi:hypothetical protein